LRYTGWFDRSRAEAARFAWPGTLISAEFTGTSVKAKLSETQTLDQIRDFDRIMVRIDDEAPKTFTLAEGLHVYPLARGLQNGRHRLSIWKRTEPAVGVITFHGLLLDPGASLSPVPRPERRILFVGDSITAGYGNEGSGPFCPWTASQENSHETWGAHAARELEAEFVAMAWSGKGVTRNCGGPDPLTMPQIYERVIPTEEASPVIPHEAADAVVINLGTNDWCRGLPDQGTFVREYEKLVQALRKRHPKALIVLGLGPMLADDHPPQARTLTRSWLDTVKQARAAQGDANVELIELWYDPAEGVGCDYHPNVRTHARLGRELAALLRTRLGW
jgi:lysophospholipase L1-like esterase